MQEQRVLVVTGAAAGIGAALALRAARAGYALLLVGRNADALGKLIERLKGEGTRVEGLVGDVRDPETSRRIAQTAAEQYGRIDILVANAGIAGRGPLALQSDDELREQLDTHVLAPLTLIREALPLLRTSQGCAFVLGSGVARVPIGGMGLYPAAKAALRSATRTLRRELRPLGIGLTYVDPGAVDTDFMSRRSMNSAPRFLLISPHTVARCILQASEKRPRELNVAPWQTAFVALSELFPRLTDVALQRAGGLTGATISTLELSRNEAVARLRTLQTPPTPEQSATPPASETQDSRAENFGTFPTLPQIEVEAVQQVSLAVPIFDAPPNHPVLSAPREAETPASTSELIPSTKISLNPNSIESFTKGLSRFASRVQRLNFPLEMLRSRLLHEHDLSEDEIALAWIGMPNKNERKLINDLCIACAQAGLLAPKGERSWKIVKQTIETGSPSR